MDSNFNEFAIKLLKSLTLGVNSKLSIFEINQFLRQAINRPNEIISINFEPKKYFRGTGRYDLKFLITKTILFYNIEIDFETRKKFLELLLSGNFALNDKQVNIKYWIRILFSDFDTYIKCSPTWEELIYLFVGVHVDNKQMRVSKIVVEQFNKNFRNINKNSRNILINKLLKNKYLQKETQKIVLKNIKHLNKTQMNFLYTNSSSEICRKKLFNFI